MLNDNNHKNDDYYYFPPIVTLIPDIKTLYDKTGIY